MRLDRFISSQCGDISRSEIKKLVRGGRVTVDGEKAKSCDMKVSEDSRVAVDGREIVYREHIYIMLNKPQGYVCSTREGSSPTVLELVPEELRRKGLFPAGRLDKDTEGFVLITDDGELAHRMLAPSHHVPKTYYVRLEKRFEESYIDIFRGGVTIDGGEKCLPAETEADAEDEYACRLTLHEGKFHQVKRMFEAVGNRVVFLKRIRIGGLDLDGNLAVGECLEIMYKDVDKLLLKC